MSRHVIEIGGTALQHLTRTSAATATPARRTLLAAISGFRPGGRAPKSPPAYTARSFGSSSVRIQHASTSDRPLRWAASSAPVATRLGLRSPLFSPLQHLGRAPLTPQTWTARCLLQQQRFQSGRPGYDEGRLAQTAHKATEKLTSGTKAASESASRAGHNIYDRLPHLHRPTKEELLSAATGFWHRLQIRFKWFSIRSVRPFNSEEIFAFLSWIFWGHVLWIVIGTTTFVSLAIWAINTVFAQETLAGWVGNYLTKSSGVKIVFESAIVPTWRAGVITFSNVFISRRPGQLDKHGRSVSKGSATAAASAALAEKGRESATDPEDDGNYSQFDVTFDKVNVTLSFTKWFNGKGLLHDVEVRGVRGVIDRTNVHPTGEVRDPKSYRHEHHTGDFEIDNFKMEDVLLTVYQPRDFRPFTVSVFNCELPRLRKQWLFYDLMSANNMSGSFDDSLFTIHPRQVHGITGMAIVDGHEGTDPAHWKKHSRLRIDGLKIDHLNRGVEGPFSWIHEGNVDIVADVMIPHDEDGSIAKVMSDFYDKLETTVANAAQQTNTATQRQSNDNIIHHDQTTTPQTSPSTPQQPPCKENQRLLLLDLRVHLNDVRASVPLFPSSTSHLSYTNTTLIRPIIAYINSRSTFIPITCRIVKRQSEFDGSWTIFDSGLLDDLSRETYEAFVKDILDQRQQRRRMRKVGVWGLKWVAQALFLGLAGQLA